MHPLSGLVLAAGRGIRLGGAVKACLNVGGKTLLERHFENYAALGVPPRRVTVVCSHDAAEGEAAGLGGHSVRTGCGSHPGTLGSFLCAFPSGDTLVVHGDLVWEPSLGGAALAAEGDAVVPVDPGSGGAEAMKARVEGRRLMELSKTLAPMECFGESMGMFLFRKPVLDDLRRCAGEAEAALGSRAALDDAVTLLARVRTVTAVPVPGSLWEEIDTPEDLERARERFGP